METDFELFYNTMFPRIYTYVRCQVRDTEAAKDIVSQSFLKAYQHKTKAPSGDAMAHWLFRIVRNTLIDHWRVDGRRQMACVSLEELPQLADGVASPEMQVATRERQATLLRVMSGLPERDRTVLALKFAAYRTNRDIAAILHLSEGAVSMRLLRALRRLREKLLELGVR